MRVWVRVRVRIGVEVGVKVRVKVRVAYSLEVAVAKLTHRKGNGLLGMQLGSGVGVGAVRHGHRVIVVHLVGGGSLCCGTDKVESARTRIGRRM